MSVLIMHDDERAWTTEQVLRITGVSRRRLAYWLDRGVVSADIDKGRGRGRVRLWSFSNLLEVKVALWLRDRVSLQLIRQIVAELRKRGIDHPLAEHRIAVVDLPGQRRSNRVVVQSADGAWEVPPGGQLVMAVFLPLALFADELGQDTARDRVRRRQAGRIERRRGRLGSAAVLAGTRVPVSAVQRLHEAGWTTERIIANYPGLDESDVIAALRASG